MAPVSNSPRVFPISCREIHLASSSLPLPRHIIHLSYLSFPPLLHRSPTLSRVHSCLLVARTSLPAVNGFLFHPCPLASPIRSPSLARATVFRSIFLFLSLFFFFFFKSCRLTEARRSFIRFSGACLLCPDHEEVSRSGERVLGGL